MTHGFLQRSLACLLIISFLVIGGLASAQSLTHDFQHSHHQKATHGTVLCSWMCAAGQVLDNADVPHLAEAMPITLLERLDFQSIPLITLASSTSRGPPPQST